MANQFIRNQERKKANQKDIPVGGSCERLGSLLSLFLPCPSNLYCMFEILVCERGQEKRRRTVSRYNDGMT